MKKVLFPFEGLKTVQPLSPESRNLDSSTPRMIAEMVEADAPNVKAAREEQQRKARDEEKQKRDRVRQIVKNASALARAEREANR